MVPDEDLYDLYFQSSVDYYRDKLEQFQEGRKFMFNIFAFLFAMPWLLFRKMYKEAAILLVILFALSLAQQNLVNRIAGLGKDTKDLIFNGITICFAIAIGWLGNYLYIKKAIATVEESKTLYPEDDDAQMKFVHGKGGVTHTFNFILLFLLFLLVLYSNFAPVK